MRAFRLLECYRPVLLGGSPICTMFSMCQNINEEQAGGERFQDLYENAVEHIEFTYRLHRLQARLGGYFLHEH